MLHFIPLWRERQTERSIYRTFQLKLIFHCLPLSFVGLNAACRSGVSLPTSLISAFAVRDRIPRSKLCRAATLPPKPHLHPHPTRPPCPSTSLRPPLAPLQSSFISSVVTTRVELLDADAQKFEVLARNAVRHVRRRAFTLQCLQPLIINAWNNTIKVQADGSEIITAILLRSVSLFAPLFFNTLHWDGLF